MLCAKTTWTIIFMHKNFMKIKLQEMQRDREKNDDESLNLMIEKKCNQIHTHKIA